MANNQALAGGGGPFNSEFANWASTGLASPSSGVYFCDSWFVTALRRAHKGDFSLEPMTSRPSSGLRLLMRDPPEMVRVWHKLPEGFLGVGKKLIKLKIRGVADSSGTPQLDSAALFQGSETDRRFDRKLFGPVILEQSWREISAEVAVNGAEVQGARFISLRFSGMGVIEVDFCRLETVGTKGGAWSAAKGLAAKVMTGFRETPRPNVIVQEATPATAATGRVPPRRVAPDAGSPALQPARLAIASTAAASGQRTARAAAPPAGAAPAVAARRMEPRSVPAPRPADSAVANVTAAVGQETVRTVASTAVAAADAAFAASGRPSEGQPVAQRRAASAGRRSNMMQNADFSQWSGTRLEHWKVDAPKAVSIGRGGAAPDKPLDAAGLTISLRGVAPDRVVSLSQPFGAVAPNQRVDIVVVGCADARTEVEIALKQTTPEAKVNEVKTRITLWPRWQFRTARLQTPPDWHRAGSRISLAIFEEQPRSVRLALVAAGLPGEGLAAGLEVQALAAAEANAVVNGSFEHWAGPLIRPLSVRRVAITDEWALVSKSPSPKVEARLTEIVPRGLRDGRDYSAVLGLGVHGELAGPYLRMEAALDILQILACSPRQLSFFARTALASTGTGASRQNGVVQQIFVAERHPIAPDSEEFNVKRLFTIKRNLRVGKIGERHEVDLRPDHSALLAAKAKEMLHDVRRSLLLIFEISGSADVAIGNVCLSGDASVEKASSQVSTDVALEDPHIAAQLTQLKGLEHWQSEVAMEASPYHRASPHPEEVKWSWPAPAGMTTDIVVCVYNAVDETLDCLDSLRRCTTIPHTVTIVDDKSTELTREQLRRYVVGKPWMRLVENPENLGYTRSANVGISSSSADWVVLLNSDTIVTPGWLEGMFDVVRNRPNVAMVGPLSNAASWQSVPELQDVRGGWSTNPLPEGYSASDMARLIEELSLKMFPEATLLNGFCTLMRRDVVEAVGYLDEAAFPMGYGEENDLCLRVRKAGYSLAIADHVYVYHVKSASFGSARRSELSKRGTAALHAKHPDVDMKATQRELAELTSLIELRKRLRNRLDPAGRRELGSKPQRGPAASMTLPAMRSLHKDVAAEIRSPR